MTLNSEGLEAARRWFEEEFNGLPNTETLTAGIICAYLSALPPVDGLEVVMEKICHKEQIGIWANEITSALALSDFLREEWTFDDSVDLEREIAAQLLDIIKAAVTHPGLDLVASLSHASSVIAGLTKERDEARKSLRTVQNAAKTLSTCRDTELEHLRQNAKYDHQLRAEHESLMERDAQMTEMLLAAEARISSLEEENKRLRETLGSAYERGRKEGIEEAAKVADRIGNQRSDLHYLSILHGKPAAVDVGYVGYTIRQLLEVKG